MAGLRLRRAAQAAAFNGAQRAEPNPAMRRRALPRAGVLPLIHPSPEMVDADATAAR